MIKMWAEKEFRNLKRINQSAVVCPEPVLVKSNILMMKFIGQDMVAAPKLKDIDISQQEWNQLYLDVLKDMRVMYQDCKLIHADYSEYNCICFTQASTIRANPSASTFPSPLSTITPPLSISSGETATT